MPDTLDKKLADVPAYYSDRFYVSTQGMVRITFGETVYNSGEAVAVAVAMTPENALALADLIRQVVTDAMKPGAGEKAN